MNSWMADKLAQDRRDDFLHKRTELEEYSRRNQPPPAAPAPKEDPPA